MATFSVQVALREFRCIDIEADSEEAAWDRADSMIQSSNLLTIQRNWRVFEQPDIVLENVVEV